LKSTADFPSSVPEALKDDVRTYERVFTESPEDGTLRPGGLKMTELAISRSGLPEGSCVLDIGCGTGRTVNWLNAHGYPAFGFDLSAKLVGAAERTPSGLKVVQATAGELPFQTNSYDCVLTECSLSAIARINDCLHEIHRVLRQNGLFLITDLFAREPTRLPELKKSLPESCLARSFIKEELLKILKRNKFDVILWEDHSEILRSMAGQKELSDYAGGTYCELNGMDLFLAVTKIRPGYFLCVAQLSK